MSDKPKKVVEFWSNGDRRAIVYHKSIKFEKRETDALGEKYWGPIGSFYVDADVIGGEVTLQLIMDLIDKLLLMTKETT